MKIGFRWDKHFKMFHIVIWDMWLKYPKMPVLLCAYEINYVGSVRVFRFIDNQWKQIGQKFSMTTPYGRLGNVVGISADGNIILVPTPGGDENGNDQGVVRVYEYSGTGWVQLAGNILVVLQPCLQMDTLS